MTTKKGIWKKYSLPLIGQINIGSKFEHFKFSTASFPQSCSRRRSVCLLFPVKTTKPKLLGSSCKQMSDVTHTVKIVLIFDERHIYACFSTRVITEIPCSISDDSLRQVWYFGIRTPEECLALWQTCEQVVVAYTLSSSPPTLWPRQKTDLSQDLFSPLYKFFLCNAFAVFLPKALPQKKIVSPGVTNCLVLNFSLTSVCQ